MELKDKDLLAVQEARLLARKSKVAQSKLATYDAAQIDTIIRHMVKVAEENAVKLAEMAVEETGFGRVDDKTFKNQFASRGLYNYIKDLKTVGIIREDQVNQIIEIAEPVGVLMGIVPSTNPTSTAIYKAIIAIKSRNTIIFSPHPSALKCTLKAAQLMNDAAEAAGAPADCIGCLSIPAMEATSELMKLPEIAMIIATGGAGMVKASYSTGKPALGVGPGNVPAYIEKTADVQKAVSRIMASKTFDNGTICASEQAVIVERSMKDSVMAEFKKQGGYFMSEEETDKVCKGLFTGNNHAMNAQLVGRSPEVIAEKLGINIPPGTRVLLGEQRGVGKEWPLSFEKLTTVLGFYTVEDWQEACELCIALIRNGGVGHSLSLHTEDRDMVLKFAAKPVFRILVNSPSTHGGVGVSTGLAPSFTLGSGTWGGSATSDNVTPLHLINIKRVAYGFKTPEEALGGEVAGVMLQRGASTEVLAGGVNNVDSTLVAEIVSRVVKSLEARG